MAAGPVGNVWHSGSWSATCWTANTWASSGAPVATAFALAGPATGIVNSASAPFTVTPNGTSSGTFTPTAVSNTTFSPTSLTWSGDAAAKTFTATKTDIGSVNINGTFSTGLTPPANVVYTTQTAPPSSAVVMNQQWWWWLVVRT